VTQVDFRCWFRFASEVLESLRSRLKPARFPCVAVRTQRELTQQHDMSGSSSLVCVECGSSLRDGELFDATEKILKRCPRCGAFADPFVEYDAIVTGLNVAMLRKQAWRHVVFNESATASLTIACFAAFALDALLGLCFRSILFAAGAGSSAAPLFSVTTAVTSPTLLQLSNGATSAALLQFARAGSRASPADSLSVFAPPSPAPLDATAALAFARFALVLFFCAAVESVLFTVAIVLCLSAGPGTVQPSRSPLVLRAVALAACAKLGLAPFFVWPLPLELLPLIELSQLLWCYLAAGVLTHDDARLRRWSVLVLFLVLRSLFRGVTGWCPVTGWS
jgi:hypothetical protein